MSDTEPTQPAPEPEPELEQPPQPDQQPPAEDQDEPLGDKGLRALEAEKAKRRDESARRRAAEARIQELEAGQDEAARQRLETERAAFAKANERIVSAEIRAAAAGKLSDPSDALLFLKPGDFEVDDDGQVDQSSIADAVKKLLKAKPYLAGTGPAGVQGAITQGVRKTPTAPTLAEQIAAAEQSGDWTTARRLKSQLVFEQTK